MRSDSWVAEPWVGLGLLPKRVSINPREKEHRREERNLSLSYRRWREPGNPPTPLSVKGTAKRELHVLFLWHLRTFTTLKAGLRAFDSGWPVCEIPAELLSYFGQKLKTEHHFSGLWFPKSLNDSLLSGEPGSFLCSTRLAGIFPFFGLQCFLASKEWRMIWKTPFSSAARNLAD